MLSIFLAAVVSAAPINLGVVLGQNSGVVDTSDQEQWCVEQARLDVSAELAAAGGRYSLNLTTVYAGEESDASTTLAFLKQSAGGGAGYVVGAYVSEDTLKAISPSLAALGLLLLAPASGLPRPDWPDYPEVLRLWPNDRWQASLLVQRCHETHDERFIIFARDDLSGKAFSNGLLSMIPGGSSSVLGGIQYYKPTLGPASYTATLSNLRDAISTAVVPTVAFICDCGSDEISQIMDTMHSLGWPTVRTHFYLTDRATPTRSVVALPNRTAFAASMRTSGLLSHIPTNNNPSFSSLHDRWRLAGHTTSLFASALSSYDAVRIAALASMTMGGGNTTSAPGLRTAAAVVANQSWGASGMMTLDSSGDLYRAVYDVYAVDEDKGWLVVDTIDARTNASLSMKACM